MTASDSKGGKQGGKGIAMDGAHLKLPRNNSIPVKFRDGSNLKVPPKPPATNKPEK